MSGALKKGLAIVETIKQSGLTIYDSLADKPRLYMSTEELTAVLKNALEGQMWRFVPKTRSKVAKTEACKALGYPVPKSFKRTKPSFPGQNFDTYVQQRNNLQVWNEELSAARRYVVIRPDANDKVITVRTVTGDVLADYDRTGKLTQKYQASTKKEPTGNVLVSAADTEPVRAFLAGKKTVHSSAFDVDELLPLGELYDKIVPLIGRRFSDPGTERLRGQGLHELVQTELGSPSYKDTGQFPDIQEQLLEVKLQTARTIDLGLVIPDSTDPVSAIPEVRHCDVRYAVFYGRVDDGEVVLEHAIVSTGEDFFTFFRKFEGNVVNKKLQIPLPKSFFDNNGSE